MVQELAGELALTLRPQGVAVACIAPGFIETPWQQGKDPAHRKRIEDKIALRRFGKPEEVAELCMQIVRLHGAGGIVYRIDGGYCME